MKIRAERELHSGARTGAAKMAGVSALYPITLFLDEMKSEDTEVCLRTSHARNADAHSLPSDDGCYSRRPSRLQAYLPPLSALRCESALCASCGVLLLRSVLSALAASFCRRSQVRFFFFFFFCCNRLTSYHIECLRLSQPCAFSLMYLISLPPSQPLFLLSTTRLQTKWRTMTRSCW